MTTLTTGKDGKATAKNLPLGQYRVVEVEAPYGYVLNPNEQKVTFTYVDDKTPVIKESLTFSDDRQKLDMSESFCQGGAWIFFILLTQILSLLLPE